MTEKETISLREYFESKLKDMDKATGVALDSLNKRLEGMNEFRDSLKDQATRLVSKAEYENSHLRLEEDIRSLRESRAEIMGKASKDDVRASEKLANRAILIGAVSAVIAAIAVIITIISLTTK